MKPVTIDKDSATIQQYLNTIYLAEAKILNLLPVAVYITDALGHIVNYNQKAEELWGRVPQKVDQNERFCGSLKLYSTDGSPIPHHHTPVAQSLADGQQRNNIEVIIERPNLSRIIVRANIVPIKDEQGNILGIVNCFYDITDQKKNQTDFNELTSSLEKKVEIRTHDLEKKNEELRKSEERYHKMIEEVEDYAIILLDKDSIIRNWNKGAEKIKGYKEEEILGKSFENFYL